MTRGISTTNRTGIVYCGLLLLPTFLWVWLDKRLWAWDQADYGYYALWLWKYFTISPLDWWDALMFTLRLKTPGLPWLAQFASPFGNVTGLHSHIFLTLILLISLGSLFLTWATARKLFAENALLTFLCPLILAATPLFIGLNQQFLVEAPQMMGVSWLLLIISRLQQWPLRRIFWHTGAACVWGCLMKVTFPLYGALPLLWITFFLIKRTIENPAEWKTGKLSIPDYFLVAFTCLSGLAGILWLTKNLEHLWLFVRANADPRIGAVYGSDASFIEKISVWLTAMIENYFTWTSFIACVLLIIIYILTRWKFIRQQWNIKMTGEKQPGYTVVLTIGLLSLLSFFLALVVHSSQANEVSRFLTPILPYFCFFLVCLLFFLRNRLLHISIFLIFFLQYFYVGFYSFGLMPSNNRMSHNLMILDRDVSRVEIINKTISQTAARPECASRWIMTGCSIPWLSRSTLNYYLLQNPIARDQNTQIFAYNFGEDDLHKLLVEIKAKRPVYFISVAPETIPPGLPAGLNLISPSLLGAIQASPWYEKQEDSPSPDILIYKIRDSSYLPH